MSDMTTGIEAGDTGRARMTATGMRDVGRGRRRRRQGAHRPGVVVLVWMSLVGMLLAITGVASAHARDDAAPGEGDDAHGDRSSQSGVSAVYGTYRFDDGTYLTLFGAGSSAEYELEGYRVGLVPDGADRFVTRDDPSEVLMVRRDPSGQIDGLTLEQPGREKRAATREHLVDEEIVRFHGDGIELSGSLLLPTAEGPHPAVVIVHGAEYATRDVYRLLGLHFARRGVATLIYDKRGVGDSAGSFAEATFDDLTGDALGGVALLRDHPSIDADRVGLVGFSQGSWVIAMAARHSDHVAFLVALSASGFSPAAQAAWLGGNLLAHRGIDSATIDVARKGWGMLFSTQTLVDAGAMPSLAGVPGFWFHSLDPHLDTAALWRGVRQPVLAMWGELDCQVPARDSFAAFEAALAGGGNTRSTLRVLPGASHSMTLVEPCAHELGGMHHHGGRFRYAPEYFTAVPEWIQGGPGQIPGVAVAGATASSSLAWHQDPNTEVPWYGTFLPQVAAFVALVAAFGAIAVAWIWRHTLGRGRSGRSSGSLVWHLAGITALTGITATAVGAIAMVELLLLSDVHTDFLVGGPYVDRVPPLLRMASVLTWVTVILAAILGWVTARRWARGRSTGSPAPAPRLAGVALSAAALFASMAGYWGLLTTGFL